MPQISIPQYQALTFKKGDCGRCDTVNLLQGDTIPLVVNSTLLLSDGIFFGQTVSLVGNTSYNFEFGYNVSATGTLKFQVLDSDGNILLTDDIGCPSSGTYDSDFTAPLDGDYFFRVITYSAAIITPDFTLCDFKLRQYTNNVSISQKVLGWDIGQSVSLSISQRVDLGFSQKII